MNKQPEKLETLIEAVRDYLNCDKESHYSFAYEEKLQQALTAYEQEQKEQDKGDGERKSKRNYLNRGDKVIMNNGEMLTVKTLEEKEFTCLEYAGYFPKKDIDHILDLADTRPVPDPKEEQKCCAGCKVFSGGEIRHHEDCVFYPESLSKMYDEKDTRIQQLTSKIEQLKEKFSDGWIDLEFKWESTQCREMISSMRDELFKELEK